MTMCKWWFRESPDLPAQFFRGVHRGMVCVLMFIGWVCMRVWASTLYTCIVYLKKRMATKCHAGPQDQHECATSRGRTKDRHKMVSSAVVETLCCFVRFQVRTRILSIFLLAYIYVHDSPFNMATTKIPDPQPWSNMWTGGTMSYT
jgi:hypothetical protein